MLPRWVVGHGVQQPHHAAGVADRLPPPHHGLARALAGVLVGQAVGREPLALVLGADGEDEQQRVRGAGDQHQQVRLGERVDVVHGEVLGHAEFVEQARQEVRVRLEGDKGGRLGAGIGIHIRHGGCVVFCWC